jgi:DNA mismatch repair protein MutS2
MPMNPNVLKKLEWPKLLQNLAKFTQTDEGSELCLALMPKLQKDSIEEVWRQILPLRDLSAKGYRAPIGNMPNLHLILKASSLGQVLSGEDFRNVARVLDATKSVFGFAEDFGNQCSTLKKFRARIYPMPELLAKINRAVDVDGELKDDASDELMKIRKQKNSLRKRIEEQLIQVLHKSDVEQYLQDDFFTMRSERYVVPMRLDGRGRVKGSIIDTSDSGQTLYIEPAAISPLNDQKQELDLAEKLEIIRIFRELSELVATNVSEIQNNYNELVALDVLTAKSRLAAEQTAGTVKISSSSKINLIDARHPLIMRSDGNPAVGNMVEMNHDQSVLIISGPNAGGKTVVLKTVGLMHLMVRAGLLVPVDDKSQVRLFDNIWIEMGDAQDLSANLSTFTGHLSGLKPIIADATSKDLILLDELAVGTDPQTGSAIAQAMLEDFADRKCSTFVTTHFETLKGLAINDKRFRNGSMEFSLESLKPTYKLIMDVPGQSYGIEVAEQLGLPSYIIERAQALRGSSISSLDEAVNQLMEARDETRRQQSEVHEEKLKAEAEHARWKQECKLLEDQRRKVSEKLSAKYDSKVTDLRSELDDLVKKLKKAYKDAPNREEVVGIRQDAEGKMKQLETYVADINAGYNSDDKLPGELAKYSDLSRGCNVYVIPLKNDGTITDLGDSGDPIEVEVGMIKLRVNLHDLRIRPNHLGMKKPVRKSRGAPRSPKLKSNGGHEDLSIGFTMPTPTNSIDLRGMDKDQALEASWNFVDRGMMRGEPAIILIHGHGTGALLHTIRDALGSSCPYDVGYRPGEEQEGGNGVTVVELR